MGRPISNVNFGSAVGKMAINFHNGTQVVTGYIVSQIGATTYVASVDGVNMFTVQLAQTTSLAQNLTAGYATIVMTDSSSAAHYAAKMMSVTFVGTDGTVNAWGYAAATTSTMQVAQVAAPTSALTVGTIANQTHNVAFNVTGTYTGTAPTALQVKVNSGSYAPVTATIGGGTYSFSLTIAATGTGDTVTVQDISNGIAGVTATSAAFNVA